MIVMISSDTPTPRAIRLALAQEGSAMKGWSADKVQVDPKYGFSEVVGKPYLVSRKSGKHDAWVDVRCTFQGCGTLYAARLDHLKRGTTKSCGCYRDYMAGQTGREQLRGRKGAKHYQWKGGRCVNHDGYVRLLVPGHPRADQHGYVAEHVKMMSDYLGRPVEKWETVHHVNGVKDDNRLENLQLRIGNHGNGQAYACSDCGSERIHPVPLKDGRGAA